MKSARQRKTRAYKGPSRQNLKRDKKELNYNTKIDSENSNTRILKKITKKERPRN